jgi:predicted negative regulator of RcsB-dependent stress response
MRVTLKDASLVRYAGRFVWLDLNFDGPQNQRFLTSHGVATTPSFYVLDPSDEHATATQLGAMTVPELTGFLDRGEQGVLAKAKTPADVALAQGDALLASAQHAEAAAAYDQALRAGGKNWTEHDRAVASFARALLSSKQFERCAGVVSTEAPGMKRTAEFGRVLLLGMFCVNHDDKAPWSQTAATVLEPLAAEAIALPVTVRDHRYELYQELMTLADSRGDKATVKHWGDRWLNELDATKPVNDDERSALDIARVDAASLLDEPARVLPALIASEKAMPTNYNASLRLGQMEVAARQNSQAIAACNRGLQHVNGPLGRSWLLQVKGDALMQAGRPGEAQRALEEALHSAREIGMEQTRENNIARVSEKIKEAQAAQKQARGSL